MGLCLVLLLSIILVAFSFQHLPNFGVSRHNTKLLALQDGDTIPNVVFKTRVRDESIPGPNPFKWKDVSSADLFSGKRCVLLSLPGGNCFLIPFYM